MIKILNHYIHKAVLALLISEFIVLVISVYIGAFIRFGNDFNLDSPKADNFFSVSCLYAILMMFSMSALGMYQINNKDDIRRVFLRLMPSLALGFGLMTLVFYIAPDIYFGRGVLVLTIIVSAIGLLLSRGIVIKSYEFGIAKSRILILGIGSLAKECMDLANSIHHSPYNVIGFVSMQEEKSVIDVVKQLPVGESLLSLARKHKADEIIVAVQFRRESRIHSTGKFSAFGSSKNDRKPIDELLECKLAGIKVIDASTFFEREASQIRVDSLQPSWLVFSNGFDQSFLRAFSKRVFDLLASFILLIVTLPIMLITSLCIFIEDRAPIFYQQERVGKYGQSFMVLKFRSMSNNAESEGKPQWASENDPRTTKVGSIIRMLRIDELPQILNVFKGDMSFVGPRPERPYFVQQLAEQISFYNVRHSIKPGITGLAQVRYQYGASVEDSIQKLQYDLYYVKNNSLFLDFLILIDTLQVVLLGKGAR